MNLWSWELQTHWICLQLGLKSSWVRAGPSRCLTPHSQSHCWEPRFNVTQSCSLNSYCGSSPEELRSLFTFTYWLSPYFERSILGSFTVPEDWGIENSYASHGQPRETGPPRNEGDPLPKGAFLRSVGISSAKSWESIPYLAWMTAPCRGARHPGTNPKPWTAPGRDILALFRPMTTPGNLANAHKHPVHRLAWKQTQKHPAPQPRPLTSPSCSPVLRHPSVYILLTSQT